MKLIVLTAALALSLGACDAIGDSTRATNTDGSPTEAIGDHIDADGGWLGGEFEAHVESVPEETPQPERFGMLVRLEDDTVGGSELVRVYFDLKDAWCADGRHATVDDLIPGTAIAFSSDPNPAGLEAMAPPPVGATRVSAQCS